MVASAAIVAAGCAGHGADGARSIRFIRLNTWAFNFEAIRFGSPAYNFEAKPNASETDAVAAVAPAATESLLVDARETRASPAEHPLAAAAAGTTGAGWNRPGRGWCHLACRIVSQCAHRAELGPCPRTPWHVDNAARRAASLRSGHASDHVVWPRSMMMSTRMRERIGVRVSVSVSAR